MAKMAWAFNLSPGTGDVNIDIDTAYTNGFLIAPKKFPIMFTPRSQKHRDVICREYEDVKPFFERYKE
jgi:hypothetical protein